MLKIFYLTLFFLSINTYACWLGRGQFSIDGESWPIHQKFELGKGYIFPGGSFLLELRLVEKDKKLNFSYSLKEKKDLKLLTISSGEEEDMKPSETKSIFAKGLPGKPHSIISITFDHI
jgi:hypothetical protein